MSPSTTVLQMPGGPELLVLALLLLPVAVIVLVGVLLVRRLLNSPDPSRVAELEREVVDLRETVATLEERVDTAGREDAEADEAEGGRED